RHAASRSENGAETPPSVNLLRRRVGAKFLDLIGQAHSKILTEVEVGVTVLSTYRREDLAGKTVDVSRDVVDAMRPCVGGQYIRSPGHLLVVLRLQRAVGGSSDGANFGNGTAMDEVRIRVGQQFDDWQMVRL